VTLPFSIHPPRSAFFLARYHHMNFSTPRTSPSTICHLLSSCLGPSLCAFFLTFFNYPLYVRGGAAPFFFSIFPPSFASPSPAALRALHLFWLDSPGLSFVSSDSFKWSFRMSSCTRCKLIPFKHSPSFSSPVFCFLISFLFPSFRQPRFSRGDPAFFLS